MRRQPTTRCDATGRRGRLVAAVVVGIVGLVAVTACSRNEFVPYSPTAEVMPPLDEDRTVFVGGYLGILNVGDCEAAELLDPWEPGPYASEWRTIQQDLQDDSERFRGVSFATRRLETEQAFDQEMTLIRDWFSEPCRNSEVDSVRGSGDPVDVIPQPLDGLPQGAVTAHWSSNRRDEWTTVIGDRDRQLMMIVWWAQQPEPVPTDDFVEVANAAWTEFVSEN